MTLTPIYAGLYTAIATIPIMLVTPLSGMIMDRFGPLIPILIGFTLIIFCFVWFFLFTDLYNVHFLIPALVTFGVGVSFVVTPIGTATISSVNKSKTGTATGMYNMISFTGATVGMSVLGAIQNNIQENTFERLISQNTFTKELNPSLYKGLLSNVPHAINAIDKLPLHTTRIIKCALLQSFSFAFSWINLVAGIISLIALILGFIFFKNSRKTRKGSYHSEN